MRGNNKGAKKMIASERYETILNLIQEQGIVKVKDLAKLMQVTETTIRRDCEELEHQGKLIRVHGGESTRIRSFQTATRRMYGIAQNFPKARNSYARKQHPLSKKVTVSSSMGLQRLFRWLNI